MSAERGQLVLLAAAVVAVALVPMLTAALQLGYHEDVRTTPVDREYGRQATAVLERALAGATDGIPDGFDWDDRSAAVATVRERLAPTLATLNRSGLAAGVALQTTYNGSAARRMVTRRCPSGPGRAFGPCVAEDGLVVQSREGQTHLVAVVVDVRVTGPDRLERRTVAVRT